MSIHLTEDLSPIVAPASAASTSVDQEHAATCAPTALPCHAVDADLWFAEAPADVETAKALCLPCPLRQPCLAGALERREPWGVWGGELVLAGVVVPRKRPRGRPRKTELAA